MAGGARVGSGRKPANLDRRRMMVLLNQGVTMKEIAIKFDVTYETIKYAVKKFRITQALPGNEEDRTTS